MPFDRVPQWQIRVHPVAITPSDAFGGDVVFGLEVGDNALRRALGDSYQLSDVAKADAWVHRQAQEDVGVIRQESPGGHPSFDYMFLVTRFASTDL